MVPNVLSQRRYVCIITSGARHTDPSSHPGASFLKDLQGQRGKKQRWSECAACPESIFKRRGHVESVAVRPPLAPPTGTRSFSHGRRCIYSTCRLNQTPWIECEEKGGKFAQSRGEKSPVPRGRGGQWWLSSCRAAGQAAAPSALEWRDAVTTCTAPWGREGGRLRADKEIAREEKGKILPRLWRQVFLLNGLFLFRGSTTNGTLRSDYIIAALCWKRNWLLFYARRKRGVLVFKGSTDNLLHFII